MINETLAQLDKQPEQYSRTCGASLSSKCGGRGGGGGGT